MRSIARKRCTLQERAGLATRWAYSCGNRIEWVVSNFAIQYLGATLVALNTWYTQRELAYVLEHADIKLLLSADGLLKYDYASMLDPLQPFSATCPKLRTVVMLGERRRRCARLRALPRQGCLRRRGGYSRAPAPRRPRGERLPALHIGVDFASKGRTAHAPAPGGKHVRHRHALHFTPDDVVFMPLSLFWGMGCMNFLIGPLAHGAHIVLQEHFDPLEALDLIQHYRCTVFPGTPNIVHAVFEHPEAHRFDLSSVRKGTPIGSPPVTLKLLQTVMPLGIRCFGLTETHGFSNMHDASDPIDKRSRTEGRVMPGFQMRIVDPESECGPRPGQARRDPAAWAHHERLLQESRRHRCRLRRGRLVPAPATSARLTMKGICYSWGATRRC
ncbi:AMP-binding protein [Cupriavidus basilensis]